MNYFFHQISELARQAMCSVYLNCVFLKAVLAMAVLLGVVCAKVLVSTVGQKGRLPSCLFPEVNVQSSREPFPCPNGELMKKEPKLERL